MVGIVIVDVSVVVWDCGCVGGHGDGAWSSLCESKILVETGRKVGTRCRRRRQRRGKVRSTSWVCAHVARGERDVRGTWRQGKRRLGVYPAYANSSVEQLGGVCRRPKCSCGVLASGLRDIGSS